MEVQALAADGHADDVETHDIAAGPPLPHAASDSCDDRLMLQHAHKWALESNGGMHPVQSPKFLPAQGETRVDAIGRDQSPQAAKLPEAILRKQQSIHPILGVVRHGPGRLCWHHGVKRVGLLVGIPMQESCIPTDMCSENFPLQARMLRLTKLGHVWGGVPIARVYRAGNRQLGRRRVSDASRCTQCHDHHGRRDTVCARARRLCLL